MKRALFLFFTLTTAVPLLGQEVMENSDFSDGTTHWHGDCKPAGSDSTTDFVTNSQTVNGLLVELRSTKWTTVTQEIHDDKAGGTPMVLTITYQTSSDFKTSDRTDDYANIGPSIGFGSAQLPGRVGRAIAMFDVPPASRATSAGNDMILIYPDEVSAADFVPSTGQNPQTFTTTLRIPSDTPGNHRTFCLAFPPGAGSVTITKISLVPGSDRTDPSQFAPAPNQ